MKWYSNLIPSAKNVFQDLSTQSSCASLSHTIYAWDDLAKNAHSEKQKIRVADLLVNTDINYQDFLSIETGDMNPFSMSREEMEDLGFNPEAVTLTKKYIKVQSKIPVNHWLLCNNEHLLHWGPISDSVEEWKKVRRKAESMTKEYIKNTKSSNFMNEFYSNLRNLIDYGPLGWYEVKYKDIKSIQNEIIKII